jgi:hypothetical protein
MAKIPPQVNTPRLSVEVEGGWNALCSLAGGPTMRRSRRKRTDQAIGLERTKPWGRRRAQEATPPARCPSALQTMLARQFSVQANGYSRAANASIRGSRPRVHARGTSRNAATSQARAAIRRRQPATPTTQAPQPVGGTAQAGPPHPRTPRRSRRLHAGRTGQGGPPWPSHRKTHAAYAATIC